MSPGEPSITSISTTCARANFEFREITEVREKVYQGTLDSRIIGDSESVYIKVYDTDKEQALKELIDITSDIGHPAADIAVGDHLCLLMAEADGRPLSHVLPVICVPGLWRVYGEGMISAYIQIGRQVGTLHSKTQNDTGPLLSDSDIDTALERIDELAERFTAPVVDQLTRLFEDAQDMQTPYALTYGDRSPHNMYWDGDQVTHIDATCKRRSVAADHASVLMGIRLMVGRLPYARSQIRTALEDAYWSGYSETGLEESMESTLYGIRYLKRSLSLLEYYNSKPRSLNTRLTKRIDPPIVRREIEQTVETIDQT